MTKIHRFIGEFEMAEQFIKITDQNLINQIHNVLKLKLGEQIILGQGNGIDILASIKVLGREEIVLEKIEEIKNSSESNINIVLYQSIVKKENFELIAQKVCELGVFKIIPIISERTIKTSLNLERISVILKEASEQSGRGIIPKCEGIVSYKEGLGLAQGNDLNILFDPEAKEGLKNFTIPKKIKSIGIFIGPEGGFSEVEVLEAKKNKISILNLGKLTLRAETASIVSVSLINFLIH